MGMGCSQAVETNYLDMTFNTALQSIKNLANVPLTFRSAKESSFCFKLTWIVLIIVSSHGYTWDSCVANSMCIATDTLLIISLCFGSKDIEICKWFVAFSPFLPLHYAKMKTVTQYTIYTWGAEFAYLINPTQCWDTFVNHDVQLSDFFTV